MKISEQAVAKIARPHPEKYYQGDEHPVHPDVLAAMLAHPKNKPLNKLGQEVADPTPFAAPVQTTPHIDMFEHMRNMVRLELDRRDQEFDEEENPLDFETDEDPFPTSSHEAAGQIPGSQAELEEYLARSKPAPVDLKPIADALKSPGEGLPAPSPAPDPKPAKT